MQHTPASIRQFQAHQFKEKHAKRPHWHSDNNNNNNEITSSIAFASKQQKTPTTHVTVDFLVVVGFVPSAANNHLCVMRRILERLFDINLAIAKKNITTNVVEHLAP